MADPDPPVEPGDQEPMIAVCMPEPDPEPIITGSPSNVTCPHFGGNGAGDAYVQQLLADKEYYESRLFQLERERDELERKFEREKRERQTVHFKYTQVNWFITHYNELGVKQRVCLRGRGRGCVVSTSS